MPTAAEIVAQSPRLASLPSIYLKVRRTLADPQVSITELARVIASDPALTARLLRAVNSPYFGLPGRVESISRALSILGMQQIHDLVVATCVATTFRSVRPAEMDMTLFWHASLFRALAARRIARRCHLIDAERPFIDALLADLGHLILYLHMPQEAIEARRRARTSDVRLPEAERQLIGCDYTQIGESLLRTWQLPEAICAAVGQHAEPPADGQYALGAAITHIAAFIAAASCDEPSLPGSEIAACAWSLSGLDPAAVPDIVAAVQAEIGQVMGLFFPQRAAA
jgi:HD-like signal output (HDOD) protein